ncbi:MAG: DnaA regulatory inactivator Hda [Pseudomonadota bacterium]
MNNPPAGQIPLPLNLGDKATFENFWVGHNTELVQAIHSSVQTSEPRLIYFYGPGSAGKSHLLFAAMKLAREEIVNTSYLSLSDAKVTPDLLAVVDVAHLVCVDDLQSWGGDRDRERALFTLFEQVRHHGGQLLLTATNPPEKCGFGLADLVSRLASGLVYPLRALTEEQQFEALKMRARNRGLSIADDAVKYLLSRASRDTGELFRLLDDIDRASLIEKRKITIPFLQRVMQS